MIETTPMLGLCRFSFVGRGDWAAYRDRGLDQTDGAIRQAIAAQLHAPERLARRFFTFERLLLASLDAQQDRNFRLLVLTSDCLPAPWAERLQRLAATRPYLTLIRSAATDVNAGFLPEITRLEAEAGQRLVQFRIDDDDCLATDYIARLRRGAVALQDYPAFAYSRPHGAVATLYPDQPTGFYELRQPFHAAGCACRLDRPDATIFSFGHFALRDRFPALLDNAPTGHLALKLPDQDSERLDTSAHARRGHREVDREQFARLLAGRFPFVELESLSQLANASS